MLHEAISHGVTQVVIHRLEAIDVDEHQGEWDAVAVMPLHFVRDDLVEKAPVMTASQRVGGRQLVELTLRRFQTPVRQLQIRCQLGERVGRDRVAVVPARIGPSWCRLGRLLLS